MSHFIDKKYNILGVEVDVLTKDAFLGKLKNSIDNNTKEVVFTPYSEFIYKACIDEDFKTILNSSDINIADGVFIQIASVYLETVKKSNVRIINYILILFLILKMILRKVDRSIIFPELLSGSTEVKSICKLAEENGYDIYLVGGSQNVAYVAAQNIRKEYPNIIISGIQSGSAFSADDKALLNKLNRAKPKILLLCYGAQKQEKWVYKYKLQIPANITICLGGTFDYLSGKRKLQSNWWSERGLNWLHRLITEPIRWKRQIVIFKLLWILAGK
ncbi:MAG: WecB/TagA/CpsF family glycosyltransferase [bacterium]